MINSDRQTNRETGRQTDVVKVRVPLGNPKNHVTPHVPRVEKPLSGPFVIITRECDD